LVTKNTKEAQRTQRLLLRVLCVSLCLPAGRQVLCDLFK